MTVFEKLASEIGLGGIFLEYAFAAPARKWRFDYAFPSMRLVGATGNRRYDPGIAIEIQGGIFSQGRHVRGAALLKEYEKLNAAAIMGWRIFFATPQQRDDGSILETLRRLV